MATGRKNQLTKQIGEYLVAAELCRRGLIATTFTGNVPDFDIIATNDNFETIPIQVKTIWKGGWQFDARKFANIDIDSGIQRVIDKTSLPNPDLICVFVRLFDQGAQGKDEFYIFRLRDLQEIIFESYSQYITRCEGTRPRNIDSTHAAINPKDIERFKNNWNLITDQIINN